MLVSFIRRRVAGSNNKMLPCLSLSPWAVTSTPSVGLHTLERNPNYEL